MSVIPLPEQFVVALKAAREGKLSEQERNQLFCDLGRYEDSLDAPTEVIRK